MGTFLAFMWVEIKDLTLSLDDWLILGLNVPALVIIILCYVWFGLNEVAAILAVSLNKIPMVAVIMREGARSIEKDYVDVAKFYKIIKKIFFLNHSTPIISLFAFLCEIRFIFNLEDCISCRIIRKK